MARRSDIDWEAIERDYRIGGTDQEVADKHKVSRSAVARKAKKEGWTKDLGLKTKSIEFAKEARKSSRPGFVYVITFNAGGGEEFFKIGMSENPTERLRQHQIAIPFVLRVVVSYFIGNMAEEESVLHQEFSSRHVRGEWYRLSREDVERIAARSLREISA